MEVRAVCSLDFLFHQSLSKVRVPTEDAFNYDSLRVINDTLQQRTLTQIERVDALLTVQEVMWRNRRKNYEQRTDLMKHVQVIFYSKI